MITFQKSTLSFYLLSYSEMAGLRIAIVGTASPKNDSEKDSLMTRQLWDNMINTIEDRVDDWREVTLISGGSSWSDHVAVALFRNHPEVCLEIHMPCLWDADRKRYVDTGQAHWSTNPGRLINTYHRKFSHRVGINSLGQIDKLRSSNSVMLYHYSGFHARNIAVGRCDVMYAFSFSTGNKPTDGGTKHTWDNSSCTKKIHISLHDISEDS